MHSKFRSDDVADGATRFLVSHGELDAADAKEVRDTVEEALAAGKQHVILDLSETTYVESAIVAAVLDANARARRFGAKLAVVVEPSSRVESVFAMSRLNHVLHVATSRQDALDPP
jgi:anti-sigma B factor antagonist